MKLVVQASNLVYDTPNHSSSASAPARSVSTLKTVEQSTHRSMQLCDTVGKVSNAAVAGPKHELGVCAHTRTCTYNHVETRNRHRENWQ